MDIKDYKYIIDEDVGLTDEERDSILSLLKEKNIKYAKLFKKDGAVTIDLAYQSYTDYICEDIYNNLIEFLNTIDKVSEV